MSRTGTLSSQSRQTVSIVLCSLTVCRHHALTEMNLPLGAGQTPDGEPADSIAARPLCPAVPPTLFPGPASPPALLLPSHPCYCCCCFQLEGERERRSLPSAPHHALPSSLEVARRVPPAAWLDMPSRSASEKPSNCGTLLVAPASLNASLPAGLRCQARSEVAWAGGRATVGAFSGKVYYEATVADEGLCRCAAQLSSLQPGSCSLPFLGCSNPCQTALVVRGTWWGRSGSVARHRSGPVSNACASEHT
jgi:hypothetical protein